MDLVTDPDRWHKHGTSNITGIFIRAKNPDGEWVSADIAVLDKPSLLRWLKSRGGENRWAEDVVGILLGHGHLHID